ncbi:hypothetical protein HJFPF1_11212 [Paramyrothecium foliicola]|nr:hypothetical protein HJFPF1_11212 [Paramyrothecium foliicola]
MAEEYVEALANEPGQTETRINCVDSWNKHVEHGNSISSPGGWGSADRFVRKEDNKAMVNEASCKSKRTEQMKEKMATLDDLHVGFNKMTVGDRRRRHKMELPSSHYNYQMQRVTVGPVWVSKTLKTPSWGRAK